MAEALSIVSGAISLTGKCTIACKHCYSMSGPKVNESLSYGVIRELLRTLKNHGVRQVFVGGGEPFLHPDLERVVERIINLGILPSVSTNAHPITRERLEKLFQVGLLHNLSVSLDGPNESINSMIRGNGSFYKTLIGMYELADFGKIMWGVNYVACRPNLSYAVETAKLAGRLGASYFNCIKFTPSGRGEIFSDELLISDDEYRTEILNLSTLYPPFGEYYQDIYVFDIRANENQSIERKLSECARSYFSDFEVENPLGISIYHNGDVVLAPPNIHLGNLKENSLEQLILMLGSQDIIDKYTKWLEGNWNGIHPARDSSRNMPKIGGVAASR